MACEEGTPEVAIRHGSPEPAGVVHKQEDVAGAVGHGGECVAKTCVRIDEKSVDQAHSELL